MRFAAPHLKLRISAGQDSRPGFLSHSVWSAFTRGGQKLNHKYSVWDALLEYTGEFVVHSSVLALAKLIYRGTCKNSKSKVCLLFAILALKAPDSGPEA